MEQQLSSLNAANPIQTFVFLDIESTNVSRCDKPKITEISLAAVHRSELLNYNGFADRGHGGPVPYRNPKTPRVMDSLTLCVDPGRRISPTAAQLSGLDNFALGDSCKQKFDGTDATLLSIFIARQSRPVCLVAHNGFGFDFPLLKTELDHLNVTFQDPKLLCGDTLCAFRDLDEEGAGDFADTPCQASKDPLYPGRQPGVVKCLFPEPSKAHGEATLSAVGKNAGNPVTDQEGSCLISEPLEAFLSDGNSTTSAFVSCKGKPDTISVPDLLSSSPVTTPRVNLGVCSPNPGAPPSEVADTAVTERATIRGPDAGQQPSPSSADSPNDISKPLRGSTLTTLSLTTKSPISHSRPLTPRDGSPSQVINTQFRRTTTPSTPPPRNTGNNYGEVTGTPTKKRRFYDLQGVFGHVYPGVTPPKAHRAAADVDTLIAIFMADAGRLVRYFDSHAVLFDKTDPYY